ncbi:MAG: tyrosine protein kinase [Solirubrobacteraceae bacterium]
MPFELQPGSSDLLLPTLEDGAPDHPYTVHTYYFGFSIPEAGIGAYLYFRAQPRFGLCQGGPVIFRGLDNPMGLDALHHDYRATMPWPTREGNLLRVDNGYSIEWVEPGELARLRYASPDGQVGFELEQRAVTPLLARGHIVPGEDDHHDGIASSAGGSEQFMHVTGELRVRGERWDVDCHAVRDRSWNQVRTEEPGGARPMAPLGWTPIYLGPDLAFNATSFEASDSDPAWKGIVDMPEGTDRKPVYAWVVRDGEPRHLTSVRREVHEYHPILLSAIRQTVEAEDEKGDTYRFSGEAIAACPAHSWPNIGFRDSVFRWTDDHGRVAHCTYQEIFYDQYVRGVRDRTSR